MERVDPETLGHGSQSKGARGLRSSIRALNGAFRSEGRPDQAARLLEQAPSSKEN
jgi:hypothetical protein